MKAFISLILFLSIASQSWPLYAGWFSWSEKKLAKEVLHIDRDLNKKRWQKVIDRAQKALPHCVEIHSERHQRCITMLRNINLGYEKTRRFNPDAKQIKTAYELAVTELGSRHITTQMARDYYYKYLLFIENYKKALPLVKEMIDAETAGANDQFEILERVTQLYALHGLLEQWPEEQAALERLLTMTADLVGDDSEDYTKTAEALAVNYCIQKKYFEFFELVNRLKLEASCQLD